MDFINKKCLICSVLLQTRLDELPEWEEQRRINSGKLNNRAPTEKLEALSEGSISVLVPLMEIDSRKIIIILCTKE